MTDAVDPHAELLASLTDARQRLQAVVAVTGHALGTLEFGLDEADELVCVSEDDTARRLLHLPSDALRGRRLPDALPEAARSGLPLMLAATARDGQAMSARPMVLADGGSGGVFNGFAFQPAPRRVVLKFWPAGAAGNTGERGLDDRLQLSQIIQTSPVAVALTRARDGTLVDVNAEWSRLTGHAHHQAIGRTTVELGFWRDPDDRQRALAALRDSGAVRHPASVMRTRDGRRVVTVMHGSNVDLDGEPHVLVHVLDMTAREEAEAALRDLNAVLETRVLERTADLARARDEAERASRVKSDFLSSMSHELRTPLNAILGFGQLLAQDANTALTPRERGFAHQILSAGSHLLELIDGLLDLARVEAGKLPVSLEAVRLAPLVEECLALMQPLALARQIAVLPVRIDPDDCHVRADRTRLRQVLLNLLSNAVKYNRDGGSVQLQAQADEAAVRIEITDTGAGLTDGQRSQLFREFERLDADQSGATGSGIGLALSQRLMLLMHGSIGVRSQPGAGATFWVRLPRSAPSRVPRPPAPASADGDAASRPIGAVAPPPGASAPRQVLYIEDNAVNVLLMEHLLRDRPHLQLVHAALPGPGLEIARSLRPALVLLDIQLPGMDGFEVLRQLRLNEVTRDIPVLAVSANAMPDDIARALAAGFDQYLTKPLDLAQLLAVLDRWLPP